MESKDSGGEWRQIRQEALSPKKQRLVFRQETRLTALNSLKVSEALEKLCQECIIQVRPNDRLNLIAVDVRNEQAAKTLLNTAMLCSALFQSGPISYGVIQGVDAEITEDEIARNLRAEDTWCKIANVRRLGRSRVVKVTFTSTKLPSYVLLGHTDRYNVTIVTDLATRKSPANVRRSAAVVGNTMTGRVLNLTSRHTESGTRKRWKRLKRESAPDDRHSEGHLAATPNGTGRGATESMLNLDEIRKNFKDGNEDKDAHRSAVLVMVDVLGDSLEPSPVRNVRVIPLQVLQSSLVGP
ncbi:hypothetical protein HPB47_001829 [Ixodes persulcatus]|uniref:Uncharacterized protein n=1 Tax=Ixodes persulcatus TaxID=34615 RepID=A0AC60PPG0_IXOPE|nr:hypothetical protein HPB47_001829 [Ixodes persulcatus]